MSTAHVVPPAASAAVPVSNPSQSRAARVVEVDVRVDGAREDEQAARVDLLVRSALELRTDRGDHAVGDREVGVVAADQEVVRHASASTASTSTSSAT